MYKYIYQSYQEEANYGALMRRPHSTVDRSQWVREGNSTSYINKERAIALTTAPWVCSTLRRKWPDRSAIWYYIIVPY